MSFDRETLNTLPLTSRNEGCGRSNLEKTAELAILPMGTRTAGERSMICRSRKGMQEAISSFLGDLFSGGRHFTTLVMNTSSRESPMPARSPVRIAPALPTNGLPLSSSFFPGPSPISITRHGTGPSPGTVRVRDSQRPQRLQLHICAARDAISSGADAGVSAATLHHHGAGQERTLMRIQGGIRRHSSRKYEMHGKKMGDDGSWMHRFAKDSNGRSAISSTGMREAGRMHITFQHIYMEGTPSSMIQTFLLGLVIGLTGALVPGPTLIATINSSARDGWSTGPRVMAGHAAVEAALFLLIIFGLGSVDALQEYMPFIAVFGGVALLVFGVMTIRGAGGAIPEGKAGQAVTHPCFAGALTSISNPYFWMWWLSIGSALVLAAAQKAFPFALAFLIGHWSADFGWYTLVSTSVHQGRRVFDERVYSWVLRTCGLFLILFGIYYLATAFPLLPG